ncbi:MAG: tRNA preQ1(34) S-adenosylmethionine ribosyltransferase-isomerase QueA [Lentisphaerae bacterium]|jgi:S-adenosylmethionine:tRNA ribosyltransferase-isomerase|nr:tRNA preQ1(34) S-adenosylmethionine ribosyltransferase-isomerase QueA [Lentisphaerota bacterium]
MLTSDFAYDLPPELIAQMPPENRGASRMLVVHRASGELEHRYVSDITDYIDAGDLMVFNDTRVFPARAFGHWIDTEGAVEILLIEPSATNQGRWKSLCRSSRRIRSGSVMLLAQGHIRAAVRDKNDDGSVELELECDGDLYEILDKFGQPPVPPYIKRERTDVRIDVDKERYQTIYARETGAVAAPTAGLHFTEELLKKIDDKGVMRQFLTLHVGPGTFKPVKVEEVEKHTMDSERYIIPVQTSEAVASVRAGGKRVIAVGSTSTRALETCSTDDGFLSAGFGRSSIFIYPPYRFKVVDAMLTNFHLPCSTLLMMVSALAGRELVFRAYKEAVERGYLFYSYGDCMLIV